MDESKIEDSEASGGFEIPERPTIVTVAKLAGVAVSSASRVLNGHSARPDTVERVRRAAREVGYVPNTAAQSLKSSKTGQIAFAVENIANPAYVEMVQVIESVLAPAGYRIVLHSTNADPEAEIEILKDLKRRYVDGLIMSPIRVTEDHLHELKLATDPVVIIGTLPVDAPVDNVRIASADGVAAAVRHLHEQGRSRIAFVNGPLDSEPGAARRRGFETGLAEVGVAVSEEMIELGTSFTVDAGAQATRALLARVKPDAIICANDLLAVGAMRALRAESLSIPDDVALVGIDNTYLTEIVHPPLSSVSLRARSRGRSAAELLLARLKDPSRPPTSLTAEPELIIRQSSLILPRST